MNAELIAGRLERIKNACDFSSEAYGLVDEIRGSGIGIEIVNPILRFIENNPDIDFGMPGPLNHLLGEVYMVEPGQFKMLLLASLRRLPSMVTVDILIQVVNSECLVPERRWLLTNLKEIAGTLKDGDELRSQILEEVEYFRGLGWVD